MKQLIFKLLLRLIKFFHLESRIPQLRQTDVRNLHADRMYYHYGRTIMSVKNTLNHYSAWRVTHEGKSYETSDSSEVQRARMNGALIDEIHYNTPCHLCDLKSNGLPCCVCNMDVYFRIIDELKQHGCS